MGLREDLVLRALEPNANIAELSREFGVSRKTAYKWLDRFKDRGLVGLEELSRRPHTSPVRTSGEVVLQVLQLRRQRPRWGPKKLRAMLSRTLAAGEVPSMRTVARILERAGEIGHGRRRNRAGVRAQERKPGPIVHGPNDVWTMDFKGWWFTGDKARSEPLTVRDAFSRFVLACIILGRTRAAAVRVVLERLFEEQGLPKAIRVDNGSPFACTSARGGLTTLSAWWVSLGIELVRGRPGHPEDNGGHERMHMDMRFDLEDHPAPTLAEQQVACDRWRHDFNHVRPHEALGQRVPAELYVRSTRPYRGPRLLRYSPNLLVRKVTNRGYIKVDGAYARVGQGLVGQHVGVQRVADGLGRRFLYELDLGEVAWGPAA